jgi:hypothetical protein
LDQGRSSLGDGLAHLVFCIMERANGDANVAF